MPLSDSDKAEYGRRLAWLHLLQGRSLVNDSLIDYSVDYYKEHASEPLLSAYFVKAIYMGDSRKGLEQRRALYREAIDSAYSRSDSTYLVRFYDRLTSLSFGEGLYRETIADSKEWEASPKAGFKEMAYYMAGLSYSRLRMRVSCMILIPRLLSAIYVCWKNDIRSERPRDPMLCLGSI